MHSAFVLNVQWRMVLNETLSETMVHVLESSTLIPQIVLCGSTLVHSTDYGDYLGLVS